MNLKVRKLIIVYSDNKGSVDLINEWSVRGGTKHIDVRIMFLRELKRGTNNESSMDFNKGQYE